MTTSRIRIIIYMLLIIAILFLLLGLLSTPVKEGLDVKPVANITPKPESDIQPKTYTVELLQVKDTAMAAIPTFGAMAPQVFNPETAYYINTVSSIKPATINKKAIFKVDNPGPVVLQMETNKAENFIVIVPQEGGKFPEKFTFKITNNVAENKLNMDLWGSTPSIENVPSNSVIGSDNYRSFPYPMEIFQTKDKNDKLVDGLMIGGLNIGNNALNIIGGGRLFDRNFTDIGDVQNLSEDIKVNCNDSKGITGILIYLGKAIKQ